MSSRQFPLFRSLAGYDKRWLRGDLIAGLTVWAVLVPHALGQVGDILAAEKQEIELQVYPTVDAAIAAIGPSQTGD